MPDTRPPSRSSAAPGPAANGRPVRKDEIELHDRGLYIESWLPERRSRRKPLLFVHGELAGSWVWERYLGYFAGRGWEGHALNLRNHHWSQTADPAELSFDTYTEDVVAAMDRLGPNAVAIGHGMGGLLALKAAERMPIAGIVLHQPRTSARPAGAGPSARAARDPRRVRALADRLGDAPRATPARRSRPDARGRAAHPAPDGPEAARGGRGPAPDARRRHGRQAGRHGRPAAGHRRRAGPDRSDWPSPSGWRSGWTPSSSRSAPIRTTGSWSASRASSRSPRRSAGSWRRTASEAACRAPVGCWYHPDRPGGPVARAIRRRIRLEAQDTALSRRRSPVRIRYAVPTP